MEVLRVSGHSRPNAVAGAVAALLRLRQETLALFRSFGEERGDLAYAPGKWTVKQVLGHLADDEDAGRRLGGCGQGSRKRQCQRRPGGQHRAAGHVQKSHLVFPLLSGGHRGCR